MKLSLIATIEVKLDEEAYATEVGKMWDGYDEHGAPEPSLQPGWGRVSEYVEQISFKLSCESNLHWECSTYGDHIITLSGGTKEQYARYEQELVLRIAQAQLDRWAKVVP